MALAPGPLLALDWVMLGDTGDALAFSSGEAISVAVDHEGLSVLAQGHEVAVAAADDERLKRLDGHARLELLGFPACSRSGPPPSR